MSSPITISTPYTPEASARNSASFSLGNRCARAIWNAIYLLFFRFSPRPCHFWRSWILRCFGAKIGRNCHIYPKAQIWAPWHLECGDEVGVADGAILYNQALIRLGDQCVVSQGSHLCTGTHNYNSPRFELVAHPIIVHHKAWICAEVFVHPGVTIGEGAVIGARAVVTRSMPDWMICAGHPCAPIKAREKF
jgi:putative colanic acid biosynthesis acetyltransferase WcaF